MLFLFAMLPVWGPLIPPIEGAVWPVTSKVTFVDQTAVSGGLKARMSFTKLRNCEIVGLSLDKNNVPIEFEPITGYIGSLVTRGTGPQITRFWFIGADSIDGMRLRFIHRCNPLWTTVTVVFP